MKIPDEFFSDASNTPFLECVICSKSLADSGEPYLIEKAIRNHREFAVKDVVFEYAMCLVCASEMQQKISSESRVQIDGFFRDRGGIDRSLPFSDGSLQAGTDQCLITGNQLKNIADLFQTNP